MKRLLPYVALSLLLTLLTAQSAAAGDTQCVGTLTGTFDNVVVPAGQQCRLINSVVHGSVKALADSHLGISNSDIAGNVEGDRADLVQVVNTSTVGGNVSIREGGPATASTANLINCNGGTSTPCEAAVLNSTVDGNIHVQKMTGDVAVGDNVFLGVGVNVGNVQIEENFVPAGSLLQADSNRIAEDLQVSKNTGPGIKVVTLNMVGENLQCFENAAPFADAGNIAQKSAGQCA